MDAGRLEVLDQQMGELREKIRVLRAERSRQKKRLRAKNLQIFREATAAVGLHDREIKGVEADLAALESEHQFALAAQSLRDAYEAYVKGKQLALDQAAGTDAGDRIVGVRIAELEGIRATIALLEKRENELAEDLRTFVQAHPKGWLHSDDVLKRYLAWFDDGSLYAFLKDNPRYSLTVDQLIQLVGIARATQFLKVSYGAVEKAALEGLLLDTGGEPVTIEMLRDLRRRTVVAPSVEIRRRATEQPIEELLDLIDPQYAEGDGDDISVLQLGSTTEKVLRKADIHRIGQLRRSGEDLTRIPGIAAKRADEIHHALVRRRGA
ncbi:MAG: hypothetical protein Q7T01_00100 [bacterium]|nr:hypothetical protein [bacterium]